MTHHDKMRMFTLFQHWLGSNYNNLPTDSMNMTERAHRFLKENPDLFEKSLLTEKQIRDIIDEDIPKAMQFNFLNEKEQIISIAATKAGALWLRQGIIDGNFR
jgi:hypothetical protein